MGATYYEVLGVAKDAGFDQIKSAFATLVHQWHPDKNHSSDAKERTQQIVEAYTVLRNPERRARYDEWLSAAEATSSGDWADEESYQQVRTEAEQYSARSIDELEQLFDMIGKVAYVAARTTERAVDLAWSATLTIIFVPVAFCVIGTAVAYLYQKAVEAAQAMEGPVDYLLQNPPIFYWGLAGTLFTFLLVCATFIWWTHLRLEFAGPAARAEYRQQQLKAEQERQERLRQYEEREKQRELEREQEKAVAAAKAAKAKEEFCLQQIQGRERRLDRREQLLAEVKLKTERDRIRFLNQSILDYQIEQRFRYDIESLRTLFGAEDEGSALFYDLDGGGKYANMELIFASFLNQMVVYNKESKSRLYMTRAATQGYQCIR